MLILASYFIKSIPYYADANQYGLSSRKIYEISYKFIYTVKEEKDRGNSNIVVYVPKGTEDDNWPIAYYIKYLLPETLYRHGVVMDNNFRITIKPDFSIESPFVHRVGGV